MKPKENIKERNAGLDALRVVSMLLIILLHSIDHSGVIEAADAAGGIIGWYTRFLYMLAQVCVNCYVLLSGYFLVTSKFRLQKLVALWMEVVFYSLAIRLVFIATGYKPFSISSLISCFVPIFTGRYWFITIYFGLYFVSPFLNLLIHGMNRKQHLTLNAILFVLMSGMVSVAPNFKGMNSGAGWGLAWFVTLYLAAAWFRLYYQPTGKFAAKLFSWAGLAAIVTVLYEAGNVFSPIKSIAANWYRYDSVPAYAMSLLVFAAFLNVEIKSQSMKKLVSLIASTTFGVYLIHTHADVSPWSWDVLNLPERLDTRMFVSYQIFAVVAIFTLCVVIDIVRQRTIGRVEGCKGVRMISESIEHLFGRCVDFCYRCVNHDNLE